MRSETDKVIFGVCGGIAEYFEIDSSTGKTRVCGIFTDVRGRCSGLPDCRSYHASRARYDPDVTIGEGSVE